MVYKAGIISVTPETEQFITPGIDINYFSIIPTKDCLISLKAKGVWGDEIYVPAGIPFADSFNCNAIKVIAVATTAVLRYYVRS